MPERTDKRDELRERQSEWAEDSETEAASIQLSVPEQDGRAPDLFLVVRCGDDLRFLDLADPGTWMIGRGSASDVSVDDRQVSRQHARLTLEGGVLALEDLGSRNGTIVNGRAAHRESVRIGAGDVIEVARCQLVIGARAGRVADSGCSVAESAGLVDVVVADPEMARLYASLRKVAAMSTTVLILGETGTGKDVLAQRIHQWSSRAARPFVRINCAGIPESLLESELFGYERGAFTGADRRKAGYFEAAEAGTVFLDEIGELSATAQVKLLNVLENRTVTRLGGTSPVPIDVRVVCATHRNLQALIAEERFRADLYYRISPFVVRVPALRQRPTEIPLLASVFVKHLAGQMGAPPPTIAPDAVAMLMTYAWPGNVRELRNAVEHAFVMSEGATLRTQHFAPETRGLSPSARAAPAGVRRDVVDTERQAIEAALAAEEGNQTRAAARLGMPRRTLVHKLARYRRSDRMGHR